MPWDPEIEVSDVSITRFFGDLARKYLIDSSSLPALHRVLAQAVFDLNAELNEAGLLQNKLKRVLQPGFCGEGSASQLRKVFKAGKQLQAKVEDAPRYLGPRITSCSNNVVEYDLRRAATKARFGLLSKCCKSLPKHLAPHLYKSVA